MNTYFGFSPTQWKSAVDETRILLVEIAEMETTATYSEVVGAIQAIKLEPDSYALFQLLDEVSKAEDESGRGLLSAVVVRADSNLPGTGFFELAKKSGRTFSDNVEFWVSELKRVYSFWSRS